MWRAARRALGRQSQSLPVCLPDRVGTVGPLPHTHTGEEGDEEDDALRFGLGSDDEDGEEGDEADEDEDDEDEDDLTEAEQHARALERFK